MVFLGFVFCTQTTTMGIARRLAIASCFGVVVLFQQLSVQEQLHRYEAGILPETRLEQMGEPGDVFHREQLIKLHDLGSQAPGWLIVLRNSNTGRLHAAIVAGRPPVDFVVDQNGGIVPATRVGSVR